MRNKLSKWRFSKRSVRRQCDMSGETGSFPEATQPEATPPEDWSSLERGRFSYLPVVPGRLKFSIEVRRRILKERPAVVAIELPETLEEAWLEAIQRLPQISVIFYHDPASRSRGSSDDLNRRDQDSDQAVFVPIEPADPFVEAIRSAQEVGAQVVFADPDSNER